MEQYYPRIDELTKNSPGRTHNVIFATDGGCPPIPNVRFDLYPVCFVLMEKALNLALTREDIRNVVIAGAWFGQLGSGTRYYLEGEQRYAVRYDSEGYKKALAAFSSYLNILHSHGKKVFLILNIPDGKELDPKYMAVRSLKNFPQIMKINTTGLDKAEFERQYNPIKNDLVAIARKNAVTIIDPLQYLCDSVKCFSATDSGEPIYKDGSHLRPSYVRKNVSFLDKTFISGSLDK